MRERPRDLVVERVGLGEVDQSNCTPPDLVLIGRSDPALRRADLHALTRAFLAMSVELAMQRQDERRILGDLEVFRGDLNALLAQPVNLAREEMRVDDDAIADQGELAGPDDAGWEQRQLVGYAVDDQRVAGVVAALEAHDDIRFERKPVDDLALAFVAPLGAHDRDIRHGLKVISLLAAASSALVPRTELFK